MLDSAPLVLGLASAFAEVQQEKNQEVKSNMLFKYSSNIVLTRSLTLFFPHSCVTFHVKMKKIVKRELSANISFVERMALRHKKMWKISKVWRKLWMEFCFQWPELTENCVIYKYIKYEIEPVVTSFPFTSFH